MYSAMVSDIFMLLTLIDFVWQLGDVDFESSLNLRQHLCIFFRRYKRDTESFCTKPTSTSDSVQVCVWFTRNIVVDGDVDALDIDTSSKDIGTDTDSLLECLELFVACNTRCELSCYPSIPFLLWQTSVNSN